MATLLIILLGTMLIQGSSLALTTPRLPSVRGHLRTDFGSARHTLLTLTLASLWGHFMALTLQHTPYAWLETPAVLLGTALIVALTWRLLKQRGDNELDLTVELTTQGASLGMALFCAANVMSLARTLEYGIGSAVTLVVLTACFNALRDRMALNPIPLALRGIPIALITAGLMALALMGFAGMVRN